MNTTKRIAFVMHEDRKTELIEWSYFNKDILAMHKIIACGNAGNILEGTLNIPIQKLPGLPLEGCQNLAKFIEEGKVDILIFFWNDAATALQKNSIQQLLQLALDANIVVVHNKLTADFILSSGLLNSKVSLAA